MTILFQGSLMVNVSLNQLALPDLLLPLVNSLALCSYSFLSITQVRGVAAATVG